MLWITLVNPPALHKDPDQLSYSVISNTKNLTICRHCKEDILQIPNISTENPFDIGLPM